MRLAGIYMCAGGMNRHADCLPHDAGEGVPLRVELADAAQRTLSFGAVPRGHSASRQLAVVNRGRAPALLSLAPARELFERLGIEALPAAPVVLRPREQAAVTLFFRCVMPW